MAQCRAPLRWDPPPPPPPPHPRQALCPPGASPSRRGPRGGASGAVVRDLSATRRSSGPSGMRSRGPGRNSGSRDTQTHPRTGRASPAPQELQVPASSGLRGGLGDPGAEAGKSGPPGGMPPAERGSPPPERRHFCPRQPGSLALHARLDRGAPVRALLLRSPPSLARLPPAPASLGCWRKGMVGGGSAPRVEGC